MTDYGHSAINGLRCSVGGRLLRIAPSAGPSAAASSGRPGGKIARGLVGHPLHARLPEISSPQKSTGPLIEFIAYRPEHISMLDVQPVQRVWREHLARPEYAEAVALAGLSWTATVDGAPVGCGGLLPMWPGRVVAWLVAGCAVPVRAWVAIVRRIERTFREVLASHGRHRIEATTPVHFAAGLRLAALLHFKIEGVMRGYGPDGSDHVMLGRVIECA